MSETCLQIEGARARGVRRRRDVQNALLALLLVPMFCIAESFQGSHSASSNLRFSVVVPPVFRVLESRPTRDGVEYRVWTNTRSVVINGRAYRFERIGENLLKVPATPGESVIVHGL